MEVSGGITVRKQKTVSTELEAVWAPEPAWALWKREKYVTTAGIRTRYLPARLPVGSKFTFAKYQVQARAGLHGFVWFLHNKSFCKANSSLIQLLACSSHIVVIRHRERMVNIPFCCSGDLGYIMAQILSILTEFVCGCPQSRQMAV
jgi:hypothetical protein